DFLARRKPVLLDGATGTYLSRLGFNGLTPELACLTRPELVEKVHQDYVAAGARIILTNTFGANHLALGRKGLAGELERLNVAAVALAKGVKKKAPYILVAGDMGPAGELLEPFGSARPEKLLACFRQQARILSEEGVDFFLLETFSDVAEAALACQAVREVSSLPLVVSFTLQAGKQYRTMMGQSLRELASWAEKENLAALGFNCGLGSSQMVEVALQTSRLTSLALWFKPNAGLPVLQQGKTVYPETPEEFSSNCLKIVAAGACFLGGCCGTGPEHIKFLAGQLALLSGKATAS
ncbi:MAG TPA: homocysteine S-methyltransferase family protein, partial [bacterium]|nr:homocysteine S-methyltransferase family protein [bacterium]